MQRSALFLILVGLCIFSISGLAQGQAVQLCVADMQVAGGGSSGKGGEQLLKALSKEKQDKSVPIERVAIPQSAPEEALAAAKQKGCSYVVTTNQMETHSDSEWWGGGTSGVNMQTFYITIAYKLTKVSDGSEVSSGSFKASDKSSFENAAGFTMKRVADKVTETIKKAGPIPNDIANHP